MSGKWTSRKRKGSKRTAEEIRKIIGARIRERRNIAEISLADVAAKFNPPISESQVSRYESGDSAIEAAMLVHLANILDCSVGFFYQGFTDGEEFEQPLPPDAVDVAHAFDRIKNGGLRILQRRYIEAVSDWENDQIKVEADT